MKIFQSSNIAFGFSSFILGALMVATWVTVFLVFDKSADERTARREEDRATLKAIAEHTAEIQGSLQQIRLLLDERL